MKEEKFSRNKIWDISLGRGSIFGHIMDGFWMHVGDPKALKQAEAILQNEDKQ